MSYSGFNENKMCAKLDEQARAMLISRAACFGIDARIEAGSVHLQSKSSRLNLVLPLEVGLCRLVAELAGILTPWVIFSAGRPPERVLLQYTDAKYRKLEAAWQATQA